jgi:predicted NBD/HSP70 family sugar kinase
VTVADICKATDLPRSTVVHALARLEKSGDIEQHAPVSQGRGRPSRGWSMTMPPGPIAVVVTAAHGTVVGVVRADGHVLAVAEAAPIAGDAQGRHATGVLELLDGALGAASVTAGDLALAVVGLPGASGFEPAPAPKQPIANPDDNADLRRFRTWDGESPVRVLSRHLGCPVYSENDANLAAFGEALSGAGDGFDTVLFVGLAHGTGAGLVIDGRLHRGRARLAGEIGHLHADDNGRLCHCGGRGCFWHTHSFPALVDELTQAQGRQFSVVDVAAAAGRDDPDVVRALLGLGHALGRRLADAVVFLDPDAIVVDGGLGAASAVIADGIKEAIHRYAPPTMARATKVLPGRLGSAAALAGAAALARREGLLPRVAGR